MRQIVLDTETTGLEPEQDHRIIEIGCVEMVDRRLTGNNFHVYLQPDRVIDAGAVEVHGITNEFLEDKPRFPDIVEDFLAYITGAELVIHNAPFDVGFMDHELTRMRADMPVITEICSVLDTLVLARRKHPGKRNNLDALCDRYAVDNSRRDKHGALLDAEILADVYLAMTEGQVSLSLGHGTETGTGVVREAVRRLSTDRPPLPVVRAAEHELLERLGQMEKPIIVCLNKEDWYDDYDRDQLLKQIREQVAEQVHATNVVAVHMRIYDEVDWPARDFLGGGLQGRCSRHHSVVDEHDLVFTRQQRDVAAAESTNALNSSKE